MKILVTGSAGFIGSNLCNHLIINKHKITGIDNFSLRDKFLGKKRIDLLKKKGLSFYNIDLLNKNKLTEVYRKNKFDCIVHLAAVSGVRQSNKNPEKYFKNNIVAFYNIIEISKKFKIKHFIFASTSSVYGSSKKFPQKEDDKIQEAESFYAYTKRINEKTAMMFNKLYNLKISALRFFTVYGPYGRSDMVVDKFIKKIKNKKTIDVYNYGKNYRDFTYIDDVVISIKKIINKFNNRNKKFEVINICNGKSQKITNLISIISKELKIKPKIKLLPKAEGDVIKTHGSNYKLKKYYNYCPNTSLEIGIRKSISIKSILDNF